MGKEGDIDPIAWKAKMAGLYDILSVQWTLALHTYDCRKVSQPGRKWTIRNLISYFWLTR